MTQGLKEALGNDMPESELFSSLVGQTITMTGVEFRTFTTKDGETETALITLQDGNIYRSSGKAILDILHKVEDVLRTDSIVAKVVRQKSKGSKFSYITLEATSNGTQE